MNKVAQLILDKQQQINILNKELEEQIGYSLNSFKNNFYFHLNEDRSEECIWVKATFTVPHQQTHDQYQCVKELRIKFFLMNDELTFVIDSNSSEEKISNKIATLYLYENEFKNHKINYDNWFNESKDHAIEDYSIPISKKITAALWKKNIYHVKESQYSLVQFVKMINIKYMAPHIESLFTSTEKRNIFITKYNEQLAKLMEHIDSPIFPNPYYRAKSIWVVEGETLVM